MRTLMHDWRNVLNGVNLRISSAKLAETSEEMAFDLADAQQLIASATSKLGMISLRLAAPSVAAIPYPADYFLEDLASFLSQKTGGKAMQLAWEKTPLNGKVVVDFTSLSQAVTALIENTLRHLPADGKITIATREDAGFLLLSWSEPASGDLFPETWGCQPFFTTERGHLGLGLFFARRVLLAHRGSLSFNFSKTSRTLQTTLRLPLEIP